MPESTDLNLINENGVHTARTSFSINIIVVTKQRLPLRQPPTPSPAWSSWMPFYFSNALQLLNLKVVVIPTCHRKGDGKLFHL
jgi:hypothetical protein